MWRKLDEKCYIIPLCSGTVTSQYPANLKRTRSGTFSGLGLPKLSQDLLVSIQDT